MYESILFFWYSETCFLINTSWSHRYLYRNFSLIFLVCISIQLFIFLGIVQIPVENAIDKFGFYQTTMFVLISLPLMFAAGFTLSYVFTSGEVKYRYIKEHWNK